MMLGTRLDTLPLASTSDLPLSASVGTYFMNSPCHGARTACWSTGKCLTRLEALKEKLATLLSFGCQKVTSSFDYACCIA